MHIHCPEIDLTRPWQPQWVGDHAFTSALLNAYSLAYPVAEHLMVRTFDRALQAVPAERRHLFAGSVGAFATHAAVHRPLRQTFNTHLRAQGVQDRWGQRLSGHARMLEAKDVRHALAVCAAIQHQMGVLSDWLLQHPQHLDDAEDRLSLLWFWHAAQGAALRGLALDLYRELGGDEMRRRRWHRRVLGEQVWGLGRQVGSTIWQDRSWKSWRVWREAGGCLLGTRGLLRFETAAARRYRTADFHPSEYESQLPSRWLRENAGCLRHVRIERWPGAPAFQNRSSSRR